MKWEDKSFANSSTLFKRKKIVDTIHGLDMWFLLQKNNIDKQRS